MKTFKDYEKEYEQAINESKLKNRHSDECYVVKKNVWISCKWEKDTGFVPFAPNAEECLEELKQHDIKLYEAVISGMSPFLEMLGK